MNEYGRFGTYSILAKQVDSVAKQYIVVKTIYIIIISLNKAQFFRSMIVVNYLFLI